MRFHFEQNTLSLALKYLMRPKCDKKYVIEKQKMREIDKIVEIIVYIIFNLILSIIL